jgi:hypothetical protein
MLILPDWQESCTKPVFIVLYCHLRGIGTSPALLKLLSWLRYGASVRKVQRQLRKLAIAESLKGKTYESMAAAISDTFRTKCRLLGTGMNR